MQECALKIRCKDNSMLDCLVHFVIFCKRCDEPWHVEAHTNSWLHAPLCVNFYPDGSMDENVIVFLNVEWEKKVTLTVLYVLRNLGR